MPKAQWPYFPPTHYLGQLEDDFQAWFADRWADVAFEDCDFYHSVDLADGRSIAGAWDLRGNEDAYFGGVDVAGKRVFEPGPASGYLTGWMEGRGAEVVGFEAGWDVPNDLLPFGGADMREHRMEIMRRIGLVHNAWWYYHRDQGLRAKMVYGNIYHLPGDLGRFDVSVFGSLLLHLRDPWTALAEAGRMTSESIVVADLLDADADLTSNVMRFAPAGVEEITNWWSIHPGAVVSMLRRLGFDDIEVTTHEQRHHLGHRMDEPEIMSRLYTVVGRRR